MWYLVNFQNFLKQEYGPKDQDHRAIGSGAIKWQKPSNTVNKNPANVCKAIFNELSERTNWPSSQRNLNVNEDVFGTQIEQQFQDDTVCALRVSCCKFGLVSCIFPEFLNCQCSTASGQQRSGGWIHINVCPDLPELLFVSTWFSR